MSFCGRKQAFSRETEALAGLYYFSLSYSNSYTLEISTFLNMPNTISQFLWAYTFIYWVLNILSMCGKIVLPFLKRNISSKFKLSNLTTEMNASLFEVPFLDTRSLNFNWQSRCFYFSNAWQAVPWGQK